MENKFNHLQKTIVGTKTIGWTVSLKGWHELQFQPGDHALRFYGPLTLKNKNDEASLPDLTYKAYDDFAQLNFLNCIGFENNDNEYVFSFENNIKLFAAKSNSTQTTFDLVDKSKSGNGIPEGLRSLEQEYSYNSTYDEKSGKLIGPYESKYGSKPLPNLETTSLLNTEWPQSLKDIEKLSSSTPSSEDISLSIDKKPYEVLYKGLQITEIELVDCSSWNFFKWGPPGTTIGWISHHEPPDIRVKDKKVTADDKGYFSLLASLVGHKIVKMDNWDDEGFYDADNISDYYAFVFDNGTIAEVVNGGFTGDGYFPSLYDTKHFEPYGSLTYLKPCLTSF